MGVSHGTRTCYVKGCRRLECRKAHLDYKRRKKAYYLSLAASQGATKGVPGVRSPIKGLTHGLCSTYEWYGCRCPECTAAIQEDWRRSKALSRAKH